jgi:hypothetical protein
MATTAYTQNMAVGWGQTWQTVTRSGGTDYQNTTGKPIQIAIVLTGGDYDNATIYIGTSTGSYVKVGYVYQIGAGTYQTVSFIVPNNHYYKVVLSGDVIDSWAELR